MRAGSFDDSAGLPVVVVVGGLPAAGKSTIARRIAGRFSLPLMGKDDFKDTLFDVLGWDDRAWSRTLGRASMILLYRFLEAQLRAGCSCVVESNFKPELATAKLLALMERYPFFPVQIHCVADGPVLMDRFKRRARLGVRHPGHDTIDDEELREMLCSGGLPPLEIGGAFLEVETTTFEAIAYEDIFALVARALGEVYLLMRPV